MARTRTPGKRHRYGQKSKLCSGCQRRIAVEEFEQVLGSPDWLGDLCKDCRSNDAPLQIIADVCIDDPPIKVDNEELV